MQGQLTDQFGELRIVRVASGVQTQARHRVSGRPFPVGVEARGGLVEEDEAGEVPVAVRAGGEVREQGVAEPVGGQDVQAPALNDGGDTERVQGPVEGGADSLRGERALASVPGRGGGGPGEVEEVSAFGVVQAQSAGDGVKDGLGDALGAASFQADVVVDADSGELGDFLAAQPRNAAGPGVGG